MCPENGLKNALYLKPLSNFTKGGRWYGVQPLGHNTLNSMVRTVMIEAGFTDGHYTNHSLRVTTVTRLFYHNQDVKVVQEQTGHRSDAVMTYRRTNDETKQNVTALLSNNVKESGDDITQPQKKIKLSGDDATYVINVSGGNVSFNF